MIYFFQNINYEYYRNGICFNIINAYCKIPFNNYFVGIIVAIILSISFLSFVCSVFILKIIKKDRFIDVVQSKYIPSELIAYVFPYIVSFMNFDFLKIGNLIGLIIFFILVFMILHRSGKIMLNPMLTIFNWKFYEISFRYPGSTELHNGQALSKCELVPTEQYAYNSIQSILILEAKS